MAEVGQSAYGNASGMHGTARKAKNLLEESRERVASLLGASPMEVVFTSGGTEADNLAIKGAVLNRSMRGGLVTSAIEHEAVLETADFLKRFGHPTAIVPVGPDGVVDPDDIGRAVDETTAVVSIMLVNNETGVLQDVARAVEAVRRVDSSVLVHTDAVQAFSCMKVDVDDLGVDMLSLSSHKFGGPKGSGVLYVRDGVALEPVLHGGGQELGRRSGTHDAASAVATAVAAELAAEDRDRFDREVRAIRDQFARRLLELPGAQLNAGLELSSAHHLNIRFPGVRNETLLMLADQAGVAASAGSACQSGAATVSHVLEAMGLTPDEARQSVRFTFGWTSTEEEADRAADIVGDIVRRLS